MASRAAEGLQITRKYAMWGAGASCIPFAVLSWGVVSGVQLQMVSELAKLYGVPFEKKKSKAILLAMLGGLTAFSHGIPGYVTAQYTWLGPVGVLLKPVFSTVVTYGIGNVFITHFEMGGTLDSFNPADPMLQQAFHRGVQQGQVVAPQRA